MSARAIADRAWAWLTTSLAEHFPRTHGRGTRNYSILFELPIGLWLFVVLPAIAWVALR